MLKILFNRSSPVVRLLEVFGVVSSYLFLKRGWPDWDVTEWLFIFLVVSYLFVRICDLIHWYPGEPRGIGIEVQFKKAIVPTAYILAITSLVALFDIPVLTIALVVLADLLMMIVAPVNGILLWFHFRDRDPLPINYFSRRPSEVV